MQTYREAIDRLYDLQKFGIKLGLSSTQALLERLGNPQEQLRCFHIAGTNGKGSVLAMLEAALLEAGIKVGLYTSPHLVHFSERFRIDGREISPQRVLELINAVWEVVDQREPPTFFEFVTAMGFLYFAQEKVELCLVETGLGGRLDATNICRPLVTVITNIGLEHQEYLGQTYARIAAEKAGIVKPGVPLIHGVAQPAARRVVEETAARLGAPLARLGREIRFRREADGRFHLYGRRWRLSDQRTNLAGRHQPGNAALALGAAEELAQAGVGLGPQDFARGLGKVYWPGRLEKWPTTPGEPHLWFDGAHNVPAARALAASADQVRRPGGPLVMVVGVMADKDISRILAELLPLADRVVFSRPKYSRAAEPQALLESLTFSPPPYELEADLARALQRARQLAGPQGTVLVTGSLFTVGEARAIVSQDPTSDLP